MAALSQELNDHTRCAVTVLRGGGNRAGADGALLWQTGFPAAVDFGRGWPRYDPEHDAADVVRGRLVDAALVLGDTGSVPPSLARALSEVPCVVVGPRASGGRIAAEVAVDTGVAGIHEGGSAARMDDVPLPLRPPLTHARSAQAVVAALLGRVAIVRGGGA
jgi:formylmethanofuran dehydrogenase subunit B